LSSGDRFLYKIVVAVRTDLKLSPGKMAVQVAHAAVSCSMLAREKNRKVFDAWFSEGQKKVVVKVKSVEELYMLRDQARLRSLTSSLVADAGLTEIPPGTVTCIGIGPAREEDIDPVTGELALM
jgi:PTH2 family peptidyl-tRNA hydrolase